MRKRYHHINGSTAPRRRLRMEKSKASRLPKDIRAIIVEYAASWRLLPWISENEIDWVHLGENPHPAAYDLILNNLDKANWMYASENPMWWPYLKKHPQLIDMDHIGGNTHPDAYDFIITNIFLMRQNISSLVENPIMIPWLKLQHPSTIPQEHLCRNIAARELVSRDMDTIDWFSLHTNPAPWALELCEQNPEKYRYSLAANPMGFDLLEKTAKQRNINLDNFANFWHLSRNNDPRAVKLCATCLQAVNWGEFSKLSNAVPYFNTNKHRLNWNTLFANPGIFELWSDPALMDML